MSYYDATQSNESKRSAKIYRDIDLDFQFRFRFEIEFEI